MSLQYETDEGAKAALQLFDAIFDQTTYLDQTVTHNIGTSEEALKLGEITSLGWFLFRNLDETNYVEIRSATGASNDIIKVPPLGGALFHWGTDVTQPYAIANTAACQCRYLLLST